jgi:ABC-type nitrate/sulfonate/bicarbonate transport system substrate-binding protein
MIRRGMALLIAGLAVAGCATAAPNPSASGALAEVNICAPADATASLLVTADKQGFFQQNGILGRVTPFTDGNVALDSILTGFCNVGTTSEAGGLIRAAKGGHIYAVSESSVSSTLVGIAAQADIKTAADLVGKKVAYPPGSSAQWFFGKYAAFEKIDPNSIEQVKLDTADTLAVLQRKDVDAVFIWEPFLSNATKEVEGVHVLARVGEPDPIMLITSYVYFGQRLVDDATLGGKVLKSLVEAQAWIEGHPDELREQMATYLKVTPEAAQENIKHFTYGVKWGADSKSKIEDAATFLTGVKSIEKAPDLSTYIRTDILKGVAADRVAP